MANLALPTQVLSGSKETQDQGLTVVPIRTRKCLLASRLSSQLFSLHPYPARWWASLPPAPHSYITCHAIHALSGLLCRLPFSPPPPALLPSLHIS